MADFLRVFVKTLTGKTLDLGLIDSAVTRISDIKSRIQDMEGIPPSSQRLVWAGHQLDDPFTLQEFCIVPASSPLCPPHASEGGSPIYTFHLVLRLRGGFPGRQKQLDVRREMIPLRFLRSGAISLSPNPSFHHRTFPTMSHEDIEPDHPDYFIDPIWSFIPGDNAQISWDPTRPIEMSFDLAKMSQLSNMGAALFDSSKLGDSMSPVGEFRVYELGPASSHDFEILRRSCSETELMTDEAHIELEAELRLPESLGNPIIDEKLAIVDTRVVVEEYNADVDDPQNRMVSFYAPSMKRFGENGVPLPSGVRVRSFLPSSGSWKPNTVYLCELFDPRDVVGKWRSPNRLHEQIMASKLRCRNMYATADGFIWRFATRGRVEYLEEKIQLLLDEEMGIADVKIGDLRCFSSLLGCERDATLDFGDLDLGNVSEEGLFNCLIGVFEELESVGAFLVDYYLLLKNLGLSGVCFALARRILDLNDRTLALAVLQRCFEISEPVDSLYPFKNAITLAAYCCLSRECHRSVILDEEASEFALLATLGLVALDADELIFVCHADFEGIDPVDTNDVFQHRTTELLSSPSPNITLHTADGAEVSSHVEVLLLRSKFFFKALGFEGSERDQFVQTRVFELSSLSEEATRLYCDFLHDKMSFSRLNLSTAESSTVQSLLALLQHGDMFNETNLICSLLAILRVVDVETEGFLDGVRAMVGSVEPSETFSELAKIWVSRSRRGSEIRRLVSEFGIDVAEEERDRKCVIQ